MSNYNLHFRGQMDDEEVMAFSRKHWAVLMPDVIPFVLFVIGIFLFVPLLNKLTLPTEDLFFQLLLIVAVVGCGYVIHRFFMHMINFFTNVIIVTNLRVVEIKKTIFLKDIKESIDIKKIQDVDFKLEGLIKNILKFGDLNITLGNSEVKILGQLPNPDFHFRLINRLKNEVFLRTQRPIEPVNSNGATTNATEFNTSNEPSHLLRFVPTKDMVDSEE